MPKDCRKEIRWVVYMIDRSGELLFWSGWGWESDWKMSRIYNEKDARDCKRKRGTICDVDIHPWDRYND